MYKIIIAECKQEVSTFNPQLSGYEDFYVTRGECFLRYHRNARYEVGGALSVFEAERGVEVVPTYSALFTTAGGTLAVSAWERIAAEFLEEIKNAAPVDAVYFSLHGAMASEEVWDPEGYLLSETRKLLGEDIPIVISMDLHGILTKEMVETCDAVVNFHTYPHVDFYETGQRAARVLLQLVRRELKPVTAVVPIPALVRGDELITQTGKYGQSIRMAEDFEQSEAGISAGVFIGNPFTDVPELQTYSFAVTNNDEALATNVALSMAECFWSHHETMQMPLISLSELGEIVQTHRTGTLGLVDAADATSSGASGDGNTILRYLVEIGYKGRVLVPIVDAPAVEQAFSAGIGGEIDIHVGGTLDPARFRPLPLKARVRILSDGRFRSESFGGDWNSGPTAVLESGNIMLVVGSRAVSLYDRSYFYAHGQNPRDFQAVVIKSPHCQPYMYADWCAQMVNIDVPGSTSANLVSLGHTRCPRPIFPLDSPIDFRPEVRIYKRSRWR